MASSFAASPAHPHRSLRLLLAEGEALIAWDMERIIRENFSCAIDLAKPERAADSVQSSRYDVVVLDDYQAPEALALAARAILDRGSGLVLSTTGIAADPASPFAALCPYLSKPYSDEMLCAAIRAAAALPGLRCGDQRLKARAVTAASLASGPKSASPVTSINS